MAGPLRHGGAPTKNHLQMDDHHAAAVDVLPGGKRLYVLVKIVLPTLTGDYRMVRKVPEMHSCLTGTRRGTTPGSRSQRDQPFGGLLVSVASKKSAFGMLAFLEQNGSATAPPKQFFLSVGSLPEGEGVRTVGRLHPDSRGATAETTPEISASAGSGGEVRCLGADWSASPPNSRPEWRWSSGVWWGSSLKQASCTSG